MTTQIDGGATGPRHFIDLLDLPGGALRSIIDSAHAMKKAGRAATQCAAGKTLAMMFEQPSTRTRFSFELAMRELGGQTIVAAGREMQLGRGESLSDTARVLSRYVDAVMIRMLDHEGLKAFADSASVPVINGLTRRSHPCQIVADIITIEERLGPIAGTTVAWLGDGNNVAVTFIEAATLLGFTVKLSTPPEFAVPREVIDAARQKGASIVADCDPREAVSGANVVVTDTWTSMGDADAERRQTILAPYQVNDALMAQANPQAIFLHCLPAHRGEEVTDSVMDGPQSAVFDEAENRIHAQKAILAWVFHQL